MDNEKIVKKWHKKLIEESKKKISRELTDAELDFINKRGSFIALEIIEDTILELNKDELIKYLNSDE